MTSRQVGRVNQQSKGETPLVSGILQRAAVRAIADKEGEGTQEEESGGLRESRFVRDFSQVSIDRGGLPKEVSKTPNQTGLPDNLKAGVENLSGYSLDDVKVHYNSPKPAQLQALAYTQGTEIHVAPGQEKHLPHEAWHVVQQMQRRVKPTMQMKGLQINDDEGLEREADVMGKNNYQPVALVSKRQLYQSKAMNLNYSTIVQRVIYPNMAAMWAAVHPGYAVVDIQRDSVLSELYNDAAAELPNCDFVQNAGTAPQVTSTPMAAQPYRIEWDTAANLGLDDDYFASAIIHELAHAASSQQYRRNGLNQNELIWANMNLPPAVGVVNPATGMTPNQLASYQRQVLAIDRNWTDLEADAMADNISGQLPVVDYNHINNRIQYALTTAFVHNDTVLGDMIYYLKAKNLDNTKTYKFARRMLKEANDRRQNGFWSRNDTEVRVVDRRAWWFQFWKW
jgi:Domain of unknown function (DUF4157)